MRHLQRPKPASQNLVSKFEYGGEPKAGVQSLITAAQSVITACIVESRSAGPGSFRLPRGSLLPAQCESPLSNDIDLALAVHFAKSIRESDIYLDTVSTYESVISTYG